MGVGGREGKGGERRGRDERGGERKSERDRVRGTETDGGRERWREGSGGGGCEGERPALPIQYTAGGLGGQRVGL